MLCGALAAVTLPSGAAVAAGSAVPAGIASAGIAPAEIVPPGPAVVRNVGLDACLTAVSAATVLMEPCDGSPRQVFRIQPSGGAGHIMIRHNGWCVRTGPGTAPRDPARLDHCTEETSFLPTSLWRDSRFVLYRAGGPGYYPLRAGQVGEPPFVTWTDDAPAAFQEWQIRPAI
ncbi:hypothetical protein JCM9533A_81570 [Catenuloplanes niger JCM 9533]